MPLADPKTLEDSFKCSFHSSSLFNPIHLHNRFQVSNPTLQWIWNHFSKQPKKHDASCIKKRVDNGLGVEADYRQIVELEKSRKFQCVSSSTSIVILPAHHYIIIFPIVKGHYPHQRNSSKYQSYSTVLPHSPFFRGFWRWVFSHWKLELLFEITEVWVWKQYDLSEIPCAVVVGCLPKL